MQWVWSADNRDIRGNSRQQLAVIKKEGAPDLRGMLRPYLCIGISHPNNLCAGQLCQRFKMMAGDAGTCANERIAQAWRILARRVTCCLIHSGCSRGHFARPREGNARKCLDICVSEKR